VSILSSCSASPGTKGTKERTRVRLGLTQVYSVDFEKKFIAIHRDGLKSLNTEMQDSATSSGKANAKERVLKVHCTSVIDTDSMKEIIYEGVPFRFCKDNLLTAAHKSTVQNFIFTGNMRSAHIL
jgi:hypothetical protein